MLRSTLFLFLFLPCSLMSVGFKGSVEKIAPASTSKSSLTFEGKKVVDAEIVLMGKKLAMRLTYDDGAQQLLVQNLAGQFVPVYKARRQVTRVFTSLLTHLGACALGGIGGAYLLYNYGTELQKDGKRIIRSLKDILAGDDT